MPAATASAKSGKEIREREGINVIVRVSRERFENVAFLFSVLLAFMFSRTAIGQRTTPAIDLATSITPSVSSESVTITATLSSGPTGTVNFYDSGTSIGIAQLNGVTATLTTGTLSVGSHSITASWPGNGSYNAVTSSAITQVVQNSTTTTLSVSASTIAVGTPVTLTAAVTATGAVTPGIVRFCDATVVPCQDTAVLGTAQLSSAGIATLKLRLGVGTHSINAVFMGKTGYHSGVSSAKTVVVTKSGLYASTTALAVQGTAASYTLTGNVAGYGTISPSGAIAFLDQSNGGSQLGSAPLAETTYAFTSGALYTTGSGPAYATSGDFNGDGNLDLVVADYSSGTVSILLGNGDGSFQKMRYGIQSGPTLREWRSVTSTETESLIWLCPTLALQA